MKETLLIDFDEVIHDTKNPIPGRRMGEPMRGAKEALIELQKKYKITIFTVWGGSPQGIDMVRKWMVYWEIPFNDISNIKINAKYYIDNRAIHFTDWESVMPLMV